MGSSGEVKKEQPFWVSMASEFGSTLAGSASHSLLPALPQHSLTRACCLLFHLQEAFSLFQDQPPGTFLTPLNSLASLLRSRVTDFSDLDQSYWFQEAPLLFSVFLDSIVSICIFVLVLLCLVASQRFPCPSPSLD